MPDLRFDVLVLAGRRDENDELAAAAGATHRALLDIAGTPMLARVLNPAELGTTPRNMRCAGPNASGEGHILIESDEVC